MHRLILIVVLVLLTTTATLAQIWIETTGPTLGTLSLATNSKGHVFAGTTNASIFRTLNWGATWERIGTGLPNQGFDRPIRDISIADNDELYIVLQGQGVFRSTNNGDTWQSINVGLPDSAGIVTVHAKALQDGMTQVFIGFSGAVSVKTFLSDNSGATWTQIPLPVVQKSDLYETFISPNSEKLIISIGYNKGLYRSTNRGQAWYRIDASPGGGDPGGSESDDNYKTIRANRQGHIFVGRHTLETSASFKNACIMRSTDNGETYEYKASGWDQLTPETRENNRVSGIAFGKGNDVYATTEKAGMYFSSNNGDNWTNLSAGLPDNAACAALAATPNNHIFAAPPGFYNVFARLDPTMSVSDLPAVIQPTVSAAPNPADDIVTISFSLEQAGPVRAEIVAMDGSKVVADYARELLAGPQVVQFSTGAIATGVYAWRLSANGSVRTGRFIVAR